MKEKIYETSCGSVHYWISRKAENRSPQLVFLPGLTADHRLFVWQIRYFKGKYPVFVWDAPAHGRSRPFSLKFDMTDEAHWLEAILQQERFDAPVIIGQSMGGYIGQVYTQCFSGRLEGFISIDSGPMQRYYLSWPALWILKRTELIFGFYPWKILQRAAVMGVSETACGRALMHRMLLEYDKIRYVRLISRGYRILAEAIEKDLPYALDCPALLICGMEDHVGSVKALNKKWHERTGIPLVWIEHAGHNANTDRPDTINRLIGQWI